MLEYHNIVQRGIFYHCMNIGFDLDKIFIDYPPFVPDKLIDRLYKQKSDGVLLYRIPSKPEQILRIISHHPIFRPPLTENIKFVKELASKQENNNKYYLISGRFGFLKTETQIILQKYNLDKIFDEMYFNFNNKQPHFFKNEIIRKLKIQLYVDDDLPLLRFLVTKHPRAKFFWLNKKYKESLAKNLFAIRHLSEMLA